VTFGARRRSKENVARYSLRVLHLTDLYPPALGGLEQHVSTLAAAQVAHGHDVAVATLKLPGSPSIEIDEHGVRIYRLPSSAHALRLYKQARHPVHPTFPDPVITADLRRLIALERPEIVHGHSWILYSFLPLKSWSRAKVVATLHSFSLFCAKQIFVHKGSPCSGPDYLKCVDCATEQYGFLKSLAITTGLRVSSPLHGKVDRFIAVSSAVAEAVARHTRGNALRLDVVPGFNPDNAVDHIYGMRRPVFLPRDDGYLMFVGALGPHKGLDVLLKAFAALPHPVPLVVIGTPRHDTPGHFPPGVIVAKDVPHAEVMYAWAHCSIAIVPSVCQEAFGMVAVEAMACGRPVIASAVGGLRDILVDGDSGIFVRPGDADQLRDAILTLLADPQLRENLGQAGRQRSRLFTASAVVGQIDRVYQDVVRDDTQVEARTGSSRRTR
jgi:glycosyltransferase involved in cell wall biosynthesis